MTLDCNQKENVYSMSDPRFYIVFIIGKLIPTMFFLGYSVASPRYDDDSNYNYTFFYIAIITLSLEFIYTITALWCGYDPKDEYSCAHYILRCLVYVICISQIWYSTNLLNVHITPFVVFVYVNAGLSMIYPIVCFVGSCIKSTHIDSDCEKLEHF